MKISQWWQRTTDRLPMQLAVLSWASIVIGVVGIIATLVLYVGYKPQQGDETVQMNVGATGVMVGLYFFAFVLFGAMIIQGRTWGMSGLVLTHVTLVLITITVIQSGVFWLAAIFGVVAAVSLALIFSPPSMDWYKQRFADNRG
ncbi:hypothetical protein [uncultured Corynebacterium sp.]|uniref:hypothetical protein n=1 Tax=uncultured Corynebacterium sp. TaxID=159447 RepID=UPI0025CC292B|nr:hypothetical protein [uncultured Corynebacterium sp.]